MKKFQIDKLCPAPAKFFMDKDDRTTAIEPMVVCISEVQDRTLEDSNL